jgi:hypothetical protein
MIKMPFGRPSPRSGDAPKIARQNADARQGRRAFYRALNHSSVLLTARPHPEQEVGYAPSTVCFENPSIRRAMHTFVCRRKFFYCAAARPKWPDNAPASGESYD